MDLQLKNSELEKKVSELEREKVNLEYDLNVEVRKNSNVKFQNADMLQRLKEKAQETEELLYQKERSERQK